MPTPAPAILPAHYDHRVSDPKPALSAHLPDALIPAVQAKLAQAHDQRVAERLRAADATLWGPAGTPEIANRLGWLTIAKRTLAQAPQLRAFAEEIRADGIRHVVLLGMGGSSLAAEVMRRSFGPQPGALTLHVLDSTDAATILDVQHAVDLQHTLFLVSSKSGGTVEPLSMFHHFHALVPNGAQFVAITDPGSGLEELAHAHGFRHVFAGDPEIGGRYSALSAFGMVPAALAGIDIEALLSGEEAAWTAALGRVFAVHDPGAASIPADAQSAAGSPGPEASSDVPAWLWFGATLSALAQAGRDKLTILTSTSLSSLGLWLEQLVAESTGKHATGILPVAEEPLGEHSVYGQDRVFLYLPDLDAPDPALDERMHALAHAGHPVITLPTHGPSDLGRVFMLAELAVAVAGWGLSINPYDQPNVQQAKDATARVLDDFKAHGELPSIDDADEHALGALLGEAEPPHYVAIMGYLEPSAAFDEAVAQLREVIRKARNATTTFGYGPRFLHSTGQFHKGGPQVGVFLQITGRVERDVEVPGRPYTFGRLQMAQALGDQRALAGRQRPVVRLHLTDRAVGIRQLLAAADAGVPA
jgi:glucose-6-phosphate isomerase